jgi:hypothetical protein
MMFVRLIGIGNCRLPIADWPRDNSPADGQRVFRFPLSGVRHH